MLNKHQNSTLNCLRYSTAAVLALDQGNFSDYSVEINKYISAIEELICRILDNWNSNLEPGDQKIYECKYKDIAAVDIMLCEFYTVNSDLTYGIEHICDICLESRHHA